MTVSYLAINLLETRGSNLFILTEVVLVRHTGKTISAIFCGKSFRNVFFTTTIEHPIPCLNIA